MFRHVILELMPVRALGKHFHPRLGRPTQELYSMAGLILLREFMNWTKEQAVWAYRFHMEVQYALNLEPVAQDLSLRTLERYGQRFAEDELAQWVLHEVTTCLVAVLGPGSTSSGWTRRTSSATWPSWAAPGCWAWRSSGS